MIEVQFLLRHDMVLWSCKLGCVCSPQRQCCLWDDSMHRTQAALNQHMLYMCPSHCLSSTCHASHHIAGSPNTHQTCHNCQLTQSLDAPALQWLIWRQTAVYQMHTITAKQRMGKTATGIFESTLF